MGYHTELIFGATLKKSTTEDVVNKIQGLMDGTVEESKWEPLFKNSFSFTGFQQATKKFIKRLDEHYELHIRCEIKNYDREIESFLEWIKPHIAYASGSRDLYAMVIREDDEIPELYHKWNSKDEANEYFKTHDE